MATFKKKANFIRATFKKKAISENVAQKKN